MDMTKEAFRYYLPWILHELTTCCFVSLDLELSGIPFSPGGNDRKTQSLQERYVQTKAAAEKYQVLQVGLTICHEDTKTGTYILQPYNFNLCPTTERGLEINRDWTFQSREFLAENNFSLDALFKQGVPYLSRYEETEAIQKALDRCTPRAPIDVVEVKETDLESVEFLKTVRYLIDNWQAQGESGGDFLNIPPATFHQLLPADRALPGKTLNNMQKWLIHQLVSAEYPGLTSRSKSSFVQIDKCDPERDKRILEARLKHQRARVRQHVGFRWIAEALAGGDLTGLDPGVFNKKSTANVIGQALSLQELPAKLQQRLKENRPVIVGHNNFTDLVYFYRCFFGPLPDTVEEFKTIMHDLFPILVDTKYMATYDCGSINPTSSLAEINQQLSSMCHPLISIDPLHPKYTHQQIYHEAGYDSMLTAMVFIKLSAKLCVGASPKHPRDIQPSRTLWKARAANYSTFAASHSQPTRAGRSLADTGSAEIAYKVRHGQLVPRLGSEFWEVYGNKLRVFGTEERVLLLV